MNSPVKIKFISIPRRSEQKKKKYRLNVKPTANSKILICNPYTCQTENGCSYCATITIFVVHIRFKNY